VLVVVPEKSRYFTVRLSEQIVAWLSSSSRRGTQRTIEDDHDDDLQILEA
jgi:hypothetical protein